MRYEFSLMHDMKQVKVGQSSTWERPSIIELLEGSPDTYYKFMEWARNEYGMFGHPVLDAVGQCLPCDLHFLLVWKEKLVSMKGEVRSVNKEAEEIT